MRKPGRVIACKKKVINSQSPCTCGSGDYCHQHLSYGTVYRDYEPPPQRFAPKVYKQGGKIRYDYDG